MMVGRLMGHSKFISQLLGHLENEYRQSIKLNIKLEPEILVRFLDIIKCQFWDCINFGFLNQISTPATPIKILPVSKTSRSK